jgi:hypothetical protein
MLASISYGEAAMDQPFDRQAWTVVAFGWAMALWATLC